MREDAIEDARESYRTNKLRRLFRMSVPSDDAIVEALKQDSFFSTMTSIAMTGKAAEEIARKLFTASGFADSIHVSVEDLTMVNNWVPEDV